MTQSPRRGITINAGERTDRSPELVSRSDGLFSVHGLQKVILAVVSIPCSLSAQFLLPTTPNLIVQSDAERVCEIRSEAGVQIKLTRVYRVCA